MEYFFLKDRNKSVSLGILCIRDPYYAIASCGRVFDKINFNDLFNHYDSWANFYNRNKNNTKITIVKYEDSIANNYNRIFQIMKYLKISMNSTMLEKILSETSIENNKKIAEKFESFKQWDSDSFIHGKHIGFPANNQNYEFNNEQIKKINLLRIKYGYV